MKHYFILFIKGMSMGIANVIPGVSGGTIALITGIYEDLINSLKSFDTKSLKLITSIDILGFIKYTNLYFLLTVFGGSIVSVFSFASLFKYLFIHDPMLIWAGGKGKWVRGTRRARRARRRRRRRRRRSARVPRRRRARGEGESPRPRPRKAAWQ